MSSIIDNSSINAINNNKNTITNGDSKTVPVDHLLQFYNAGFRKLIPLLPDSKRANVYENLITDEEIKLFPAAEGKPVRIIYQNPNFWTENRLKEKSHLFNNVATTFGLTDLKDSKGRALSIYGVDVDSKQAYETLKDLIETLKGVTYVVKSHKEYGYHFYILTPVLHEAMGHANFKPGAEIEIKTDMSLGTMHLPPSRHRKYPYWNYERVSVVEKIYIDEDDTVFQQIIKAMSEYIRKEPTEENILTLDAYPSVVSGSNLSGPTIQQQQQQQQRQQPSRSLLPEQIDKAVDIILQNTNSYVEYARNDFVYGLSGHLFHNGISELSATTLVGKLCRKANDEESDDRLDVVSETYKNGKTGKPVRGISQLKFLLAKYNSENEARVSQIITELNEALKIVTASSVASSGSGSGSGSNFAASPGLGKKDIVAETMVELAESNGDIFLKDTFDEPYAIINTGSHVEVVSMDTGKFAYHLRTLLKHNKDTRIISNDSLEKAVETLKAEAIVEGRTLPLHLRVAWRKRMKSFTMT